MSEKLIPFDFEAAKADSSRIRHADGDKPVWAEIVRDCVIVRWPNSHTSTYVNHPGDAPHFLRLAAKTRKVGVRLYQDGSGKYSSRSSDWVDVAGSKTPGGSEWASEIHYIDVEES